ncbi:hypothetical protein PPL_01544 [Heterostelium album PN500]|uniref:Uncharacterized protein n=1 Tax=Heterostelium pallidum (strain ATCC 26659 / Pp 5 / PN500) TaxID=670386 RepID=D3AZT1_HETP5|nr:hypothetical protein PPL_01544 [Heterostelium album PN500]EFA84555.1 hypothetical protein PPL_01544 [Heterostelium album PN500]|eukprot:XP_020436668.1 hypothetical protein PPL_01544 [Heterostelium album PN500]
MEYINPFTQNIILKLLIQYNSLDIEPIADSNCKKINLLDDPVFNEEPASIDGIPCLDKRNDDLLPFLSFRKKLLSLSLVCWRWFNYVSKQITHLSVKLVGDNLLSFSGPIVNNKRQWSVPFRLQTLESKYSLYQSKNIITLTVLLDSSCQRLMTCNEIAKITLNSNLPTKLKQMIPTLRRKKAIEILNFSIHNLYTKLASHQLSFVNLIFKRCYQQLGQKIVRLMNNIKQLFTVESLEHLLIQSDFVELADLVVGLNSFNLKTLNCNILYHQIIQDCKLTDNRQPIFNNFFQLHTPADPYHQTENTCQWTSTTPAYHYTNIRQHVASFCDSIAKNKSIESLTLGNYCSNFSHKRACFCHDTEDNSIPSKLRMPLCPLLNESFANAIKSNNTIKSLTLSNLTGLVNESFFKAMEANKSITSLSLIDSTLQDNANITQLVKLLEVNKTLKYISIANNPQIDTGKPLSRILSLNNSIEQIDISFNQFKDLSTFVSQTNHFKPDPKVKSITLKINGNNTNFKSEISKLTPSHVSVDFSVNQKIINNQQNQHISGINSILDIENFDKELKRFNYFN